MILSANGIVIISIDKIINRKKMISKLDNKYKLYKISNYDQIYRKKNIF